MAKLRVASLLVASIITVVRLHAASTLFAQPSATAPVSLGSHHNDDSCDIAAGGAPAATLLLPYFEVDLAAEGEGRTTVFSITNVGPYSQIAHVVLYTDWAYPVLGFNLFLTGYDVQAINLYDVIAKGVIGGAVGTKFPSGNAGTQSFSASAWQGNPNFLAAATGDCATRSAPSRLSAPMLNDVWALLSRGRALGGPGSCLGEGGEQQVGGNHGGLVAVGYATIDVVATCTTRFPTDRDYFRKELLFDNVLIGEYQDINQDENSGNYAGGSSMVHIRAVPEGGPAGAPPIGTNLPYTFYDRYLSPERGIDRTFDRRQPLPSVFAARWIEGSSAAFGTHYKIWREAFTTGAAGGFSGCDTYVFNSAIPLVEIVRFDERENAAGSTPVGIIVGTPTAWAPSTPAAFCASVTSSLFPVVPGTTDHGGWTYMNLSNGGDASAGTYFAERSYNATRPGFGTGLSPGPGDFHRDVSQNWVTVSMTSEGRYGVDYDAAWLGNGCSPALPSSSSGALGNAIGRIAPAGGVLVCPTGVTTVNSTAANSQCKGYNVTP